MKAKTKSRIYFVASCTSCAWYMSGEQYKATTAQESKDDTATFGYCCKNKVKFVVRGGQVLLAGTYDCFELQDKDLNSLGAFDFMKLQDKVLDIVEDEVFEMGDSVRQLSKIGAYYKSRGIKMEVPEKKTTVKDIDKIFGKINFEKENLHPVRVHSSEGGRREK